MGSQRHPKPKFKVIIVLSLIIISYLLVLPGFSFTEYIGTLGSGEREPIAGSAPADWERVTIQVQPDSTSVPLGNNNTVGVKVTNIKANDDAIDVFAIVTTESLGAKVRNQPIRRAIIKPGESIDWTFSIIMEKGRHVISVDVYYRPKEGEFESMNGLDKYTFKEHYTFSISKGVSGPTFPQKLASFVLVSASVTTLFYHLIIILKNGKRASIYKVSSIGMTIGGFFALTRFSAILLNSSISTGLMAFSVVGAITIYIIDHKLE